VPRTFFSVLFFVILAGTGCKKAYVYPDTFHPAPVAKEFRLLSGKQSFRLNENLPQRKVVLLYFGFSSCVAVCPVALSNLSRTYELLSVEEKAKVRVFFITVDPLRDTPEIARQYAARFHSDFTGLSGSGPEVKKVIEDYSIYASQRLTEIDHTSGILYLTASGDRYVIRRRIPAGFRPEDLAGDIRLDL